MWKSISYPLEISDRLLVKGIPGQFLKKLKSTSDPKYGRDIVAKVISELKSVSRLKTIQESGLGLKLAITPEDAKTKRLTFVAFFDSDFVLRAEQIRC